MSQKVDRYYVDSDGNPKSNIVIRDRISPLGKQTYPTDIAVEVTMGMFPGDRGKTVAIADAICRMLNEE
jgi:hypothetical protein